MTLPACRSRIYAPGRRPGTKNHKENRRHIFSMPANRQLCFHQSSGRQLMPLPLSRNCAFHFPSALSAYPSGFCNLEKEQRFQSPFSKTTGHFYRNNLSSSSKYPNTLHKMSGHFQQKNLTIPTGFSDTPPPEALWKGQAFCFP